MTLPLLTLTPSRRSNAAWFSDQATTSVSWRSLILCLASDDASGTTAAEIVVDGGTTGAPWGAPVFRKG